jgi:C4-dicarboxylate-specific signal transduction histidine kinase
MSTLIDITKRKHFEEELKEKTIQLENLNFNLENRIKKEIAKVKKQEKMLMQQTKLAAMGEMIGAIAHQWRQPLSTIVFIIENLENTYNTGKLNKEYLDKSVTKAKAQIKYMSKTIDDFRNFFKPSKTKEVFDVVKSIYESISLLHMQFENALIKVRISSNIPEFFTKGYLNEFKQVIINILTNAKEAICDSKKKGLINKETGEIIIDINGSDNGPVIIQIQNNGQKIPLTIIERIFEPYYSTKETDQGMGMGLYMSKIIIGDHMGGKLYAKNTKNGVIFAIELKKEV